MVKVLKSIVRGPLEPYAAGFAEDLLRQGYSRAGAEQHVCFVAHLDRWLSAAHVGLSDLSGPVAERYLAERCAAGYVEYRSAKALQPLRDYLAPLGVLPVPQEAPPGPVEELLGRYRGYLLAERGLTAGTVRGYVDCVRPFIAARARGDVLDLAGMATADVTGFVLATCPGRAVGSAKLVVCALRSLLRWLHLTGIVPASLATAVPTIVTPPVVNWWAYRLSVVRGFATYLHAVDPAQEVPAADLLPQRPLRASPYLYSDTDIAALIAATASLRTPLRRATFATLISLLAVTGMRIGEAIALDRDDIDATAGLLTVRHGKFDKARLVPLHPTSIAALQGYLRQRDRLAPVTRTAAAFVSNAGTRLLYCNVHATWKRLVAHAALRPRSASCRPRIHDMRHSFAVRAMLDAYASDEDGQIRLTLLSAWLGHVHPGSTYWYLSASPELMAVAGGRLEAHLAGRS